MLRRAQTERHAARLAGLVTGSADRLRAELEQHGIRADLHRGRGVALVSVWLDLLVWVEAGPEGLRYRWWTGRVSERTGRYVYTGSPAHAVEAAARRIAARYRELVDSHPLSPMIAEWSAPGSTPARVRPYSAGSEQR